MIYWKSSIRARRLLPGLFALLLGSIGAMPAAFAVGPKDMAIKNSGLTLPSRDFDFGEEASVTEVTKVGSKPADDGPIAFEADAMGYDKDNGVAVAKGNVTLVQGDYVLNADKIIYYQQTGLVVAEGNVSVMQPTGEVFFADRAQLKDDMQKGVIQQFKARMTDNSLFAARQAEKVDVATTVLKKAVYTPCDVCEAVAPFWQVKASKMTIDEREEEITYDNARMEILGVPVMYTPYLSQPTPDAAGRSGFLMPEYSSSNNLGNTYKQPYYWRIAHDKDLVLTPWLMSEESVLLQGDYRQLTNNGEYNIAFSGTNPNKRDGNGNETYGHEFRGHMFARGVENVGDYSRVGFDINRTTDDTYIRRYGFGWERSLFSRAYGETAQQRNYLMAQALAIQGLRATDNPDTTPMVLPTIEGYYETEPFKDGLRLHAFGDVQSLTRKIGADQHRIVTMVGGTLPHVSQGGHVINTTMNLRQDVYNVDNVNTAGDPNYDGTLTRTIPQAAMEWRYPLIKSMESGDSITVEPIALAVAQPDGGNPPEIPNEDNTLLELTDSNLFSLNRMPGYDTVESGARTAYGFRSQYLFAGGESLDMLLGQNYSFSDDSPFPNSTKQGQNASDYIGRVGLTAQPVHLSYGFGLDHEDFSSHRSELIAGFNKPWLNLEVGYRNLNDNLYLEDSEEVSGYVSFPIAEEWTVFASGRRDMSLDQMIASSGGLIYHNECFSLMLMALRNYTRDRDIEPDTSVSLRIGFKNLGEFGD
jgi:LPS-assembly protein